MRFIKVLNIIIYYSFNGVKPIFVYKYKICLKVKYYFNIDDTYKFLKNIIFL